MIREDGEDGRRDQDWNSPIRPSLLESARLYGTQSAEPIQARRRRVATRGRRHDRKRAAKPATQIVLARWGPSRHGPMTLHEDRTRDGRKIRMLNVVDEFTRECLCIRVGRKLGSAEVIDVLSDLFILRGTPGYIRSDNVLD